MHPTDQQLYSLEEAATLVEPPVSRQAVYTAFRHGRLKGVRLGRRIFVTLQDYNEYRQSKYKRLNRKINGQLIFDNEKGRFTVLQAADKLNMPRHKIYYLLYAGALKALRVGGSWVITQEHMEQFKRETAWIEEVQHG